MSPIPANNLQEVRERIAKGDQFCKTVYEAMIYQVAKEIGAQSVVLQGDIDAIVITGGIANDSVFVNRLAEYCRQLAPILLFPGEEEMQALVFGVCAFYAAWKRQALSAEKDGLRMLNTFEEILAAVRGKAKKTIAIAMAEDEDVLSAVSMASAAGLAILFWSATSNRL